MYLIRVGPSKISAPAWQQHDSSFLSKVLDTRDVDLQTSCEIREQMRMRQRQMTLCFLFPLEVLLATQWMLTTRLIAWLQACSVVGVRRSATHADRGAGTKSGPDSSCRAFAERPAAAGSGSIDEFLPRLLGLAPRTLPAPDPAVAVSGQCESVRRPNVPSSADACLRRCTPSSRGWLVLTPTRGCLFG